MKILLDGKENGIAVWLFPEKKFLSGKDNRFLFKSFDSARAFLSRKCNLTNPMYYKFWLVIGEEEIDIDSTQFVDDHYEYYSENDRYDIYENYKNKIIDINYIVFLDGDNQNFDRDKKESVKISKDLYRKVKEATKALAKDNNMVDKVTRENGVMIVHAKSSTIKFKILTNYQIANLNLSRKDTESRCIPFDKSKDKYQTLFMYTVIDDNDRSVNKVEEKEMSESIKDAIIDYLRNNYSDINPRYSNVEFKGYILE